MTILITAGGTQEPIDSVRSITNHATGRLGVHLAEAFAEDPRVTKILYLCSRHSLTPQTEKAQVVYVRGTHDLEAAVSDLLPREAPAAIIHSMAVSDYRVKKVTTVSHLASAAQTAAGRDLAQMRAALEGAAALGEGKKLGSQTPDMALLLEKTPKIIALLRPLAPRAVIVGFKLLDSVPTETLLETGMALLAANHCDYVFANDMATIIKGNHCGYLLDKQGEAGYYKGKEAIAAGIAAAVLERAVVT